MALRSLLSSRIGAASRHVRRPARQNIRLLASEPPSQQPEPVVTPTNASGKEQSWLTHRVKANPALYAVFLGFARALGYGSPKQLANRRALHLYNTLCATRADQETDFWRKGIAARSPFYGLTHALRNVPSRMCTPSYFPVLVYRYQSARMAPHRPFTGPPCTPWIESHTRVDRSLFPRCRRARPCRASAWGPSTPFDTRRIPHTITITFARDQTPSRAQ